MDFQDAAGADHFSKNPASEVVRHFYWAQDRAFGRSVRDAAANDGNPFFLEQDRGRIACDALAATDCARFG